MTRPLPFFLEHNRHATYLCSTLFHLLVFSLPYILRILYTFYINSHSTKTDHRPSVLPFRCLAPAVTQGPRGSSLTSRGCMPQGTSLQKIKYDFQGANINETTFPNRCYFLSIFFERMANNKHLTLFFFGNNT